MRAHLLLALGGVACGPTNTGKTPLPPQMMDSDGGAAIADGGASQDAGTGPDALPMLGGCDPTQGEGFTMGQRAQNWTLRSSAGGTVDLWDFCGKVIFYEESSEW